MIFGLRRVGQDSSGITAGSYHIVSHFELLSDHAGHRLDTFNIDFLKLLNPAEDAIQFCHHRLDSLFRESDVGKFRDTTDGCFVDGHRCTLLELGRLLATTHLRWQGELKPRRAGMSLDTAIDHPQIAVPTALEAECVAFYRQLFGFPEIPKSQELQGRGSAWFQIERRHVGVDPEPSRQRKCHGFLVPDLARREVLAQGIRINQASVADGLSWFFVADPAGNRIEIGHRA